jgi:hypothetical protein
MPAGLPPLQITMEIRAYRERPAARETGRSVNASQRANNTPLKGTSQALWEYLLTQIPAPAIHLSTAQP